MHPSAEQKKEWVLAWREFVQVALEQDK